MNNYNYEKRLSLKKLSSILKHTPLFHENIVNSYLQNLCLRLQPKIAIYPKLNSDMTTIFMRYTSVTHIGYDNFEKYCEELENKIISIMHFPENFECNEKDALIKILENVINSYYYELRQLLISFSREELLILFYCIASCVGQINTFAISAHRNNVIEDDDIADDIKNYLIDMSALLISENSLEYSHFIAAEKKCLELIVNFILNMDMSYQSSDINKIEIRRIIAISYNLTNKIFILETLRKQPKEQSFLTFKENSFILKKDMADRISNYFSHLSEKQTNHYDDNTIKIINTYEKEKGFSPIIFNEYLGDLTKQLNMIAQLLFVEKEFLIRDIINSTNKDFNAVSNFLENLTLPISSIENLDKTISHSINRIYRSPLIQIGAYYITSHSMLVEANQYIFQRILKGQMLNFNSGNIKKQIKKFHDEIELLNLQKLLLDYKICGGINFALDKNSYFKEKLSFIKGIKKELDFYYIINDTLYIAEYKNWSISMTISDIAKNENRESKEINKILILDAFLLENIQMLDIIFDTKINNIISFLVFKNDISTTINNQGNNSHIKSFNIHDFMIFCEQQFIKYNS